MIWWLFHSLTHILGCSVLFCLVICAIYSFIRRLLWSGHVGVTCGGKPRVVLVTGCDTGFGNAVARALYTRGFRVYAGCLQQASVEKLVSTHGDRMCAVKMDVTKDTDINNVVQLVQRNGDGLWAVINNAGIASGAYVDWTDVETYKRVMSVNFFAGVHISKACLPLLRKTGGRVINVTSILGFTAMTGASAYCAAKFAFEAFSDVLRLELQPWGVDVSIIEPGFFDTEIVTTALPAIHRLYQGLPAEKRALYGDEWWQVKQRRLSKVTSVLNDPALVVNAMIEAVTAQHPLPRYQVGWDAKYVYSLVFYLPTRVRDWLLWLVNYQSVKPAGLAQCLAEQAAHQSR